MKKYIYSSKVGSIIIGDDDYHQIIQEEIEKLSKIALSRYPEAVDKILKVIRENHKEYNKFSNDQIKSDIEYNLKIGASKIMKQFRAEPGKGIVCNTNDDTSSVLDVKHCKIYQDNIKNAEGVLIDNGIDESDVQDVLQAVGYVLLDVELYPSSDESTITSSTKDVDLSSAISTGKSCISELRKIYPDIPVDCRYRRSHSWSGHWYVTFYLMLPVEDMARAYRDEVSPDDETDYDSYWEYIHNFTKTCNRICKRPEFTNDETQCAVEYFNDGSGPSGAVLRVFDLAT